MATTKAKTGNIVDFDAAKLTGSLGNLDGSQLTNIRTIIKQSGNPSTSTNPTGGVGTMYVNTSNGATFCCTDSTTNANIWMNVGEGSGNIIQPINPNDNFPDMQENTSVSHTFTGSSDPDGNVVSHVISDISSDKLTVNDALVADGQPHVFNAGDVDADLNVTFIVKTIDNDGVYSTGRTITVTIHNDEIPVAPADNGSFPDLNKNETYNHVFTGGTDDNGVTHYLVENISDAAVTVTNAEVAAGNAHSFVTTNVGADTPFTFTLKAKDTIGQYSTPVTYTSQVLDIVYTIATSSNSTNSNGVPSGDYIYHTFNQSGTFTVSTAGSDDMDFLVIAGGAGGGSSYSNYWGGGGGGGGAYRSSVTSNGGGSGLDSKLTPQTYTIEVGGGGAGGPANSSGQTGNGTNGEDSSIGSTIVVIGGGGGGSSVNGGGNVPQDARCNHGDSGGSGGAGCMYGNGASSSSYGNNGGNGGNVQSPRTVQGGGGGGGAGAVGGSLLSIGSGLGHGGAGLAWVDGTSRGGGGGGGAYSSNASDEGNGSDGGGDGKVSHNGTHGNTNKGGGGGGSGAYYHGGSGGNGGSGVVIVRYKFQN